MKYASMLFKLFGSTSELSDTMKDELNVLRDRKASRESTGYPVKIVSLNTTVSGSNDYVQYTEMLLIGKYQCKIDIVSQRREFCSAQISIFSPALLQWNLLSELDFSAMKTPANLAKDPDWDLADNFQKDRGALIDNAVMVIEHLKA